MPFLQPHLAHQQVISQYRAGEIALTDALHMLTYPTHPPAPGDGELGISKERLLAALRELDQLVGLQEVKAIVREVFAYLYMQRRRAQLHLRADPMALHMVFKGNPGTGKTTVARILARMFHECGLLAKGHLVEVERADLVGEYIGHTAQKTREQIKRALGGVLFIDEAYSLARGGEKDFGREAIDCLVKGMEDYREQFIVILAGYAREMDAFLATNPGLPSRFPIQLTFPDYDDEMLICIARQMAQARQYQITPEAEAKIRQQLMRIRRVPHLCSGFSNARWVRNTLERAMRRHALRLFDAPVLSREQMMTLKPEDFQWGEEEWM
ncbi:stage V sporulation protein K [Alicyclobacillus cellulosilyticus]|uniref:Stage V sporulation protein K n=1 Tax=Alicyclobacillus cellulosilyticus TaxID=1003997 RepID=A0A917KBE6_9BACL|nr:AAA family ATPase [Alicyclobacillus cellulosilyticus]GGJ04271.1 stage V sporulation protein K [Alicyclobacillus cellulosilyticus]